MLRGLMSVGHTGVLRRLQRHVGFVYEYNRTALLRSFQTIQKARWPFRRLCWLCDDSLGRRRQPLDRQRRGCALGFKKSILRLLPLLVRNSACWRLAVLESLPLRRPSERSRPAIIGLLASVCGVGRAGSGSDDAGIRSYCPCPPAGRRHRHGSHRLARSVADTWVRSYRGVVHVRRCRSFGARAARVSPLHLLPFPLTAGCTLPEGVIINATTSM
jgi:hypothetical protein